MYLQWTLDIIAGPRQWKKMPQVKHHHKAWFKERNNKFEVLTGLLILQLSVPLSICGHTVNLVKDLLGARSLRTQTGVGRSPCLKGSGLFLKRDRHNISLVVLMCLITVSKFSQVEGHEKNAKIHIHTKSISGKLCHKTMSKVDPQCPPFATAEVGCNFPRLLKPSFYCMIYFNHGLFSAFVSPWMWSESVSRSWTGSSLHTKTKITDWGWSEGQQKRQNGDNLITTQLSSIQIFLPYYKNFSPASDFLQSSVVGTNKK